MDSHVDEALRRLEGNAAPQRLLVRVVAALLAFALFSIIGRVVGNNHSGLALVTIILLCPVTYAVPTYIVDATHRRAADKVRRAHRHLTAGAATTPTAASAVSDLSLDA